MATIDQLSTVDTLALADRLPIWSDGNGDTRALPINVLTEYVDGLVTAGLGAKANATAIGIAGTANDMGTYTGTTIADGGTAKENIQALETAVELRVPFTTLAATTGATLVGTATEGTVQTAVNARVKSVDLAAAGGSALVGDQAPWTGSVARTVAGKLDDLISAKDFGAKGDGIYTYNAAMTAGSATLTSSSNKFTAADVGKIVCVPGAGASGANLTTTIAGYTSGTTVTLATAASTTVSGQRVTFGTDDTAAVQACISYAANNTRRVAFPAGIYCLNGAINTPHKAGWGFSGNGPETTIFSQFADNVAIFDLGAGTTQAVDAGGFHSLLLEDFRLSYAAQQPSTATNAACLAFSSMVYWSTLRRIYFERGYDGIKVRSTRPAPWGSNWDDLRFVSNAGDGYLTGCAMDWTGAVQGSPNNKWGRFVIEMGGMTKPAFNQIRGYNWDIGTLEFLGNKAANSSGGTGQMLMNLQAGAQFVAGCIKLETFDFTGPATHFASNSLIYAPSATLNIKHLSFSGNTASNDDRFNTTGTLAIFGGPASHIVVDTLVTLTNQATNIVWSGVSAGLVEFGQYQNNAASGFTGTLPLSSIGGGVASDYIVYRWNAAKRAATVAVDANYNATTNGGANCLTFTEPLTTSRPVELNPSGDYNFLFNGFEVEIISRGAVNGTNMLVIRSGGNTKATISADNTKVILRWGPRNATAHNGWRVVYQGAA